MTALQDFYDSIRLGLLIGYRAARDHWHMVRWCRAGGNPDQEPQF